MRAFAGPFGGAGVKSFPARPQMPQAAALCFRGEFFILEYL
jgi:hypothetical protein